MSGEMIMVPPTPGPFGFDEWRIRELERVLSGVALNKLPFDMRSWFSGGTNDCGTAACAFGWAARHEPFRNLGLLVEKGVLGEAPAVYLRKDFYHRFGYEAAREFFGLDALTAYRLFSPEAYPSPGTVTAADVARLVHELRTTGKIVC